MNEEKRKKHKVNTKVIRNDRRYKRPLKISDKMVVSHASKPVYACLVDDIHCNYITETIHLHSQG